MEKRKGKDEKLLVISFLDVQTVEFNGMELPYPQFLPTHMNSLSVATYLLNLNTEELLCHLPTESASPLTSLAATTETGSVAAAFCSSFPLLQ